jgi:hypothetical protein
MVPAMVMTAMVMTGMVVTAMMTAMATLSMTAMVTAMMTAMTAMTAVTTMATVTLTGERGHGKQHGSSDCANKRELPNWEHKSSSLGYTDDNVIALRLFRNDDLAFMDSDNETIPSAVDCRGDTERLQDRGRE